MPDNAVMPKDRRQNEGVGDADAVNELRRQQQERYDENNARSLDDIHADRARQIREEAIQSGTTLAPIRVEDLPSQGLFYPEGTRIYIRPATLNDIKRWTSMDEGDAQDINEKVQNILESCCKLSYGPDSFVRADWKDLIDIDRMYLIFAIHDYTFQQGTNDIYIKVDENHNVRLDKDNVDFIKFSDKLMDFYNPNKRCFSFPVRKTSAFADTDGKMDIYMPKIGVANWIMDYMRACETRKDNYDKDMAVYANLLIRDWRGLNKDKYYELVNKTSEWGTYEWTLLAKVKDIIVNATMTPRLKYMDGGIEREVRVSFRDGFKGIFEQPLDIDL